MHRRGALYAAICLLMTMRPGDGEVVRGSITASLMPADGFCQIIERAAQSSHAPETHVEALRRKLRKPGLDEMASLEVAFGRYLNNAYSWSLWGAAYVIHGGCSNDGFEYFRLWLVSRGRNGYERAPAEPDSLAELDATTG